MEKLERQDRNAYEISLERQARRALPATARGCSAARGAQSRVAAGVRVILVIAHVVRRQRFVHVTEMMCAKEIVTQYCFATL